MKDLETLLATCSVRADGEPLATFEVKDDEIFLRWFDDAGNEYVVMAETEMQLTDGKISLLCRLERHEYDDQWLELYFYTETPVVNLPQRDTFKAKG